MFALRPVAVLLALPLLGSAIDVVGQGDEDHLAVKESVVLLEPGAGELRVLRYEPSVGERDSVIATIREASETVLPGRPSAMVPRLGTRLTLDAIATESTVPGRIGVKYTVVDGTVLADPAANRRQLGTMQAQLAALASLGFGTTMTDRGLDPQIEMAVREESGPLLVSMLRGYAEKIMMWRVPLPEEPIGPGARWHVLSEVDLVGLKVQQIYEYELLRIEGSRLTLKLVPIQVAEPQTQGIEQIEQIDPEEVDRIPPEIRRRLQILLLSVHTGGAATIELDLKNPTSTIFDFSSMTEMRRRMSGDADAPIVEERARLIVQVWPRSVDALRRTEDGD